MKLATRIFKRNRGNGANDYYITSPFGYRKDPKTGKVTYHNGVDYGTLPVLGSFLYPNGEVI